MLKTNQSDEKLQKKFKKLNIYYMSFLVCKEYEDKVNGDIYLKLSGDNKKDLPSTIVEIRDLGFSLKREGKIKESKEAFRLAAESGDPISQYELAKILGIKDDSFEALLANAQKKIKQADIELYNFYLDTHQYSKAYEKLQACAMEKLYYKTQFAIKNFPNLPQDCVIYNFEASEKILYDEASQKASLVKKTTLESVLYKSAEITQNGIEKKHFYNLAAVKGHALSIISLIDYDKSISSEIQHVKLIKQLIKVSQYGGEKEEQEIICLLEKGNSSALSTLLELSFVDKESNYYIKLMEEAAKKEMPLTLCSLGMMYYRGIGVRQNLKKGTEILDIVRPKLKELANSGDIMAQYQLGWIGVEQNNYGEGWEWLIKSARYFLPSLHKLGDLYQYGIHLGIRHSPTDPEQAKVCYVKAADLGYVPSQVTLGWISLEQKNYEQALAWFKKGMSQGYRGCQHRLKKLHNEGEEPVRKMITELARYLAEDQNAYAGTKEWAKEILKGNEDASIQSIISQTADNFSQQEPLVQQKLPQEEEEQKIDTDDSEKIKESSHNKQILSFTSFLYDNPQAVAEAQISALMNFVGKNISTPKTQMGQQNHAKEVGVFNEELRSFLPMKNPSLAKVPLVYLTQADFLDEKLLSQAEYFTQTGISFATLREAVEVGTVHMLGGLPPAEEESILDSAIDWMGLSRLSENFLEDFSHLL